MFSVRELCIMNQCNAEEICAKWVAFVQNKKLGLKVTIENLDLMEREVNNSLFSLFK
jgi:hypothetical protein